MRKLTFLPHPGSTDLGELTWKESHPLPGVCQFSQDAVCRIQSERGVPVGLARFTGSCSGGKITFSLPLVVSAWLRPLFLWGTW